MPVELPIMRIELNYLKQTLLQTLETRHGELKEAIEKGVDLATKVLPQIMAERCRQATVEAVERAVEEAMQEYYGPDGEGYNKILKQISEMNKEPE